MNISSHPSAVPSLVLAFTMTTQYNNALAPSIRMHLPSVLTCPSCDAPHHINTNRPVGWVA
eukprot:6907333-Lingulodinium_polyedra.AAC.1